MVELRRQFYEKNYKLRFYELVNKLLSFGTKKLVSLKQNKLGNFHSLIKTLVFLHVMLLRIASW